MSGWFNSSLIDAATSEDLPNGEQNIFYNLNICDQVRAKKLPAAEALRQLKRRVMHINPNVQILALHLLDLLVKNGGAHFLEAMAAPGEFLSAYTGQIRSQSIQGRDPEVVALMLEYLQQWAHMTSAKPQLGEFTAQVEKLRSQNYQFPPLQQVNAAFIEAKVAPEWVDSDTCMKSGQPFSFYNRKHHCRNCGGVYVGEYCKDFVPLPDFGITEPVRVCVDCKEKLGGVVKPAVQRRGIESNNSAIESGFDRDLRRALELSVGGQTTAPTAASASAPSEEMDEDMKAAIAASLADMQQVSSHHAQAQREAQAEAQNAQYNTNKALPPKPRQLDQGLISDRDIERVAAFKKRLESATPQEAIYDATIGTEERHAVSLQPKVVKDLGDAADKLQTLEDLHSRIQSISQYYDRFLDAELQRAHAPRQRQGQGAPQGTIPTQPRPQGVPQGAPQGVPQGVPQGGPQAHPAASQAPRVPSYAPAYSQPISRQATGNATPVPSAPSAPAQTPAGPSAPQFPDAPVHAPAEEPVREPSPEPMLIDL